MSWNIMEYTNGGDSIIYIEINSIDGELEGILDKYISKACYGNELYDNSEAKEYIKEFIDTDDADRRKGAISEFFLHVFLNYKGYIQECAFKNLEEKSPKKGFDGVYKDKNGEIWYMESKSGYESSTSHVLKVQEAYRDLCRKFKGKGKSDKENNPWENAVNHVLVATQDMSLVQKFLEYSKGYKKGISVDINTINIMPSGTVFCNGIPIIDLDRVTKRLFRYFKIRERKGLYAICVTNRSVSQFEAYLDK